MKRALLGALAGLASIFTFHQAMWAIVWLWSPAGRFPAPYHLNPYPPFGLRHVAELALSGAFWGVIVAIAVARSRRGRPMETAMIVGALSTLFDFKVVGWLVTAMLLGDGLPPALTVDNALLPVIRTMLPVIFVQLTLNMAWGIGAGLIYVALLRSIRASPSSHAG